MLGLEFLLCDEHTLTEEVLVDELAVSFRDQPARMVSIQNSCDLLVITYMFANVLCVGRECVLGGVVEVAVSELLCSSSDFPKL